MHATYRCTWELQLTNVHRSLDFFDSVYQVCFPGRVAEMAKALLWDEKELASEDC